MLSQDLCSTKSCPSNVLFSIVQENLHPAGFFLKVKILLKSGASDEDINSGITALPRFYITPYPRRLHVSYIEN